MVEAHIRIQPPGGTWKTDISGTHADTSFQIHSAVLSGECAVETVVVSGDATERCVSELDAHAGINDCAVVTRGGDGTTVRVETCDPSVLPATARAGAPLLFPIDLRAGALRATFVGTHAALSSLGEQLRATGCDVGVTSVQSDHDVRRVLTNRQTEVLFTAVEHGYYRSPRDCTLTDVAEQLDIAKSTCSETLQRAEEAIIEYFCHRRQSRNGE